MRGLALTTLLLCACTGSDEASSLDVPAASAASFGPLPAAELIDSSGAAVSPARLKGSTWALFCLARPMPMQTGMLLERLAEVHGILGTSDVHLVGVTVDPTVDTPEVLAAFAEEQGLDAPGRHLWTGSEAQVARLLHGAYRSVLVGATANELELFMSGSFEPRVVVIDREGLVRGAYDLWTDSGDAALVERLKAVSRE